MNRGVSAQFELAPERTTSRRGRSGWWSARAVSFLALCVLLALATPAQATATPAQATATQAQATATQAQATATPAGAHRHTPNRQAQVVPTGWKSATYGRVTISVPSNWAVKRATGCPNTAAPGALLLGAPATPINCPYYHYPVNRVTVTTIPVGDDTDLPSATSATRINGIRVLRLFGSPNALEWIAPSVNVEISGSGPQAGRIVHTLRAAA